LPMLPKQGTWAGFNPWNPSERETPYSKDLSHKESCG